MLPLLLLGRHLLHPDKLPRPSSDRNLRNRVVKDLHVWTRAGTSAFPLTMLTFRLGELS